MIEAMDSSNDHDHGLLALCWCRRETYLPVLGVSGTEEVELRRGGDKPWNLEENDGFPRTIAEASRAAEFPRFGEQNRRCYMDEQSPVSSTRAGAFKVRPKPSAAGEVTIAIALGYVPTSTSGNNKGAAE